MMLKTETGLIDTLNTLNYLNNKEINRILHFNNQILINKRKYTAL